MKTLFLILLLTISLIAEQKNQNEQPMPEFVVDAKNFGLIDAKEAYYIIGSYKYGTMKEAFAFAYEKDALEHVKKHGGSVVDYKTFIKMDVNISK